MEKLLTKKVQKYRNLQKLIKTICIIKKLGKIRYLSGGDQSISVNFHIFVISIA